MFPFPKVFPFLFTWGEHGPAEKPLLSYFTHVSCFIEKSLHHTLLGRCSYSHSHCIWGTQIFLRGPVLRTWFWIWFLPPCSFKHLQLSKQGVIILIRVIYHTLIFCPVFPLGLTWSTVLAPFTLQPCPSAPNNYSSLQKPGLQQRASREGWVPVA